MTMGRMTAVFARRLGRMAVVVIVVAVVVHRAGLDACNVNARIRRRSRADLMGEAVREALGDERHRHETTQEKAQKSAKRSHSSMRYRNSVLPSS